MISKSNRSSAQNTLLEYIGGEIEPYGFEGRPIGQSFYRTADGVKCAFHLSFIPHREDFTVTADVAIRLNDIEHLVNKYDSKLTPSEQKKSMTLGVELGNLSQAKPLRWTITDMEDVYVVGDSIRNSFGNVGWPFLEKHSYLTSVYQILIGESPLDLLLSPLIGPRYMRAVASAYLLGETQKLLTVIPRYEAKLREENDLYLEDFLSLSRNISSVPS